MNSENPLQLEGLDLYNWCQIYDLIAYPLEGDGHEIRPEVAPSTNPVEIEERIQKVNIIKIATYIDNLPKESLLGLAYTPDLEKAFAYEQAIYKEISRCLVIEGLGIEIPSMEKSELKQNNLRTNENELLTLRAEQICRLWKLIREGFPYIKDGLQELDDLDFAHDPVKLTCYLVEELANKLFAQKAFEYCPFDTVAIAKDLKLVLENDLDTGYYNSKLNPLFINSKIFDTVLPILEKASLEDSRIRELFEEYIQFFNEFEELRWSELVKRDQNGKVLKSHYWQNGVKYQMC